MRDTNRVVIYPTVYGPSVRLLKPTVFGQNRDFIITTFTKTVIREALKRTCDDITNQLKASKCAITAYRTALKSDMFSSALGFFIAEVITEKFGYEVIISGNDDSKPDLYITKKQLPIEIKATTGMNWTGGEFSDRPYPTILVSYNLAKREFFVCLLPIIKEWKSNMNRKRYGTKLSWASVRSAMKYILFGNINRVSFKTGKVLKGDMFRARL